MTTDEARTTTRPSAAWRAQADVRTAASLAGRRRRDALMRIAIALSAALALIPLVLILGYLLVRGLGGLSLALLTALPKPVGEPGGGIANAIAGSLLLLGIAAVCGIPVGLLAGTYLAERPNGRLAAVVRFVADVLNGTPSIVVGIAVWAAVVRPMQRFSALAGGVALAVILAPLVARTTEQMLRLVPPTVREAALALGFTEWRTALRVIAPAAGPGIATGLLVALSRVAGETAPLLFTAFGNPYWSVSPSEPIAAVPLQIYTYALSPYDEWRAQAWAAALGLVGVVAVLTIAARAVARRPRVRTR
ncbi:MAG: phosphate ABC transporter permease PstA [Gemmatimonadaceae bacterium]|nr:phosphate ABC transporter permease PstA [Gemmatimonadaceae bacterium]